MKQNKAHNEWGRDLTQIPVWKNFVAVNIMALTVILSQIEGEVLIPHIL